MRATHLRSQGTKPDTSLKGPRVATQPFQVVPHSAPVDKWLTRTANASQVGLLILAVFGYFYTVIPVYQKSLLDEEIAKKTLDLQKKEGELAEKSAELASLTTAVTKMHDNLNHSQAEVARLKGAMSEQYSELRYRLLEEFQLLGLKLCLLDKPTEGSFGACLIEKVLLTSNLKSMSLLDRELLTTIIQASNSETLSSWQRLATSFEKRREAYQRHKREAAAKCEEHQGMKINKTRLKLSELDFLCKINLLEIKSELMNIEIDALDSVETLTRERLSEIARTFMEKAVARR